MSKALKLAAIKIASLGIKLMEIKYIDTQSLRDGGQMQ